MIDSCMHINTFNMKSIANDTLFNDESAMHTHAAYRVLVGQAQRRR